MNKPTNGIVPATLGFRLPYGWAFDSVTTLPEWQPNCCVIGAAARVDDCALLGKLAEYASMKKTIWLDLVSAHSIYVMGKRRSGKSHTLGVIIEDLASQAWLSRRSKGQAVVVFDTMNVFLTASSPAAVAGMIDGGSSVKRFHLASIILPALQGRWR